MSRNCNDKQELAAGVAAIPEELGSPDAVLADNGYANGAEVERVEVEEVDAYVSTGTEGHRRLHDFRPLKDKPPKEWKADWLRKMAERLQTNEGQQLYALRRQTVEPVFGVIKSALGFRMFSLRGIELVRGEWNLVALAYNCKRINTLRLAEGYYISYGACSPSRYGGLSGHQDGPGHRAKGRGGPRNHRSDHPARVSRSETAEDPLSGPHTPISAYIKVRQTPRYAQWQFLGINYDSAGTAVRMADLFS